MKDLDDLMARVRETGTLVMKAREKTEAADTALRAANNRHAEAHSEMMEEIESRISPESRKSHLREVELDSRNDH